MIDPANIHRINVGHFRGVQILCMMIDSHVQNRVTKSDLGLPRPLFTDISMHDLGLSGGEPAKSICRPARQEKSLKIPGNKGQKMGSDKSASSRNQ